MIVQEHVSLKPYNSFGLDVNACYFCELQERRDIALLQERKVFDTESYLIIGEGNNILFTKDFEGYVIHNQLRGIEIIEETTDTISLKVAAGEDWHAFVLYCCEKEWYGIENLAYIPSTVGAAPVQNIGAYGTEIKNTVTTVEAYHIPTREFVTLTQEQCKFGYRTSVFKDCAKQYIILSVTFQLSKIPQLNTTYKDINEALRALDSQSTKALDVANVVTQIRKRKLPEPSELGSAGSFFKNPVVSKARYESLKNQYPAIISYSQENDVKLAAGWLIEQCGWKGYRQGEVGVYDKQSLILVNYGHATGQDILALARKITASVQQKFEIDLQTEVNIL
ncbi:UDP-N-acetylenolpyruvoylglucosamine reductase [Bacteroidia bacterium]|nr:UDP-N-acetylenolpyruvoylglucosamine reductase [Bacteroidia bacterium]